MNMRNSQPWGKEVANQARIVLEASFRRAGSTPLESAHKASYEKSYKFGEIEAAEQACVIETNYAFTCGDGFISVTEQLW